MLPARDLELLDHQTALRACQRCPSMVGPVITGDPIASKVMLVGQAPGPREGDLGRPFAWTAGKTLFKWFASIGLDEATFRSMVYMAAVCRCFPGRKRAGGDRVPDSVEISNCAHWMMREFEILQPDLIIPVGKLAISQFIEVGKLVDVIGAPHRADRHGRTFDVVPLPHPSGASTWHRTEPGVTLLQQALKLIEQHHAWQHFIDRTRG
jgi:uracil-DNA glycosylase